MTLPDNIMKLFFLAWLQDLSLLEANRKEMGVTHKVTEQAAWCMEMNEQIAFLTDKLGLSVILIGGNGASLRLDAKKQRGSADNDYLTDATPEDIERLMQALEQRFDGAPEQFFRPKLLKKPEGAQDLALRSYVVEVPDLLPGNSPPEGSDPSFVKLEFHMKDDLPESEALPERHWSTNEKIALPGPIMPYQIAMKLVTLVDPPIGIEASRFEAIPKQLYDCDVLFAQVLQESDWDLVQPTLEKIYGSELQLRNMALSAGEPYEQIASRLREWTECQDRQSRHWQTIQSMQGSQLQSSNRTTPERWLARCERLHVLLLLLRDGSSHSDWLEILDQESKLSEVIQGRALKLARKRAFEMDTSLPNTNLLRPMFWVHVAGARTASEAVGRAESFTTAIQDAIAIA